MNYKCKKLIQGFNRKLKCGRTNKEICLSECKNCKYFKRKDVDISKYTITNKCVLKRTKTPLKQVSKKRMKLEKSRFSLFTDNLELCYLKCGNKKKHMHEIFRGRNRNNSMRYGLCLPLCDSCHSKYQNDNLFNEVWHIKGQKEFNKKYRGLDFQKIFKINYLK